MNPTLARILRRVAQDAGPALASTARGIARDEVQRRAPKHQALATAAVESVGAALESALAGSSLSLSAGAMLIAGLTDMDAESFALLELAMAAAKEQRTQRVAAAAQRRKR